MAYRTDLPRDDEQINLAAAAFRENWSQLAAHNHNGTDFPAVDSANVDYASTVSGFTPAKVSGALDALAGVRIVEMGSNENGEYIKWENGLMVCWNVQQQSSDVPITTAAGSIYESDVYFWTFPAVFNSTPAVSSRTQGGSSLLIKGTNATTGSSSYRYVNHSSTTVSAAYAGVGHIAIGRWK